MPKISTPKVLVYKRPDSDTYAVAVTAGSDDYHDALLMSSMEFDLPGDSPDAITSAVGYYMAQRIQALEAELAGRAEKESKIEPEYWLSVHRYQSYLKFTLADAERDVAENGGLAIIPLYTMPPANAGSPADTPAS